MEKNLDNKKITNFENYVNKLHKIIYVFIFTYYIWVLSQFLIY